MTDSSPTTAAEESRIRAVIDRWVEAFRRNDADLAASVHAPDVVSFDIVPPLRYQGMDEYRGAWDAAFELFDGPIVMDLSELTVTAGDDLAFSRSFNHFQAKTHEGETVDYWFRWTACFRKLAGEWRIVHDHTSLPTDFETGQAVLTLRP